MSIVIGIVSEGQTDYLVLKKVIDKITGDNNQYRHLQPETDMTGRFGNGWKGVWKWCREMPPLDVLMDGIQPRIDIIIIQMDGDVIRKEREIHCACSSTVCEDKGNQFPIYCHKAVMRKCPVAIPCPNHSTTIDDMIAHGKNILSQTIGTMDKNRIIITIPCDSTDAWIVASYDEFSDIEKIEDPWRNIIARGKFYHDIRIRGDKKSVSTYSVLAAHLEQNWELVKDKCLSAKLLDEEIREKIQMLKSE